MIVVNTKRSIRRLLDNVALGIPDDVILEQLKRDTTTEWSGISAEALYAHYGNEPKDYLLGVYGDKIVSAYQILGWEPGERPGRKVIKVGSAGELAGAIGEPVPGGPWKRGEARPVRYFETPVFLQQLDERGLLQQYEGVGDDVVDRRMVDVIRGLAQPNAPRTPLDGVEVEADPRGGVRVTVPMGTKVTVVQRDR